MDQAITAQTITISGGSGAEIEAYRAMPSTTGTRGGIVVIHHLPGWDRWTKELARRFAVDGYDVLAPHLYSRIGAADPDDAAAAARAARGVPDAQVVGDVAGAVNYLRGLPSSNGKVAVIGHCSGGRHAILAAVHLPLQAAVDCYGAFVIGDAPPDFPVAMTSLEGELANLSCPVLGLFGEEDAAPNPASVAEFDRQLTELGKPHEFHSYPGAGHAFFNSDRPSYRVDAAQDAYPKIAAFFARTIG